MLSSPREVIETRTSFPKPAIITKNYYSNASFYFYVYELTVESLGFYMIVGLKISIPKRGLSNTKKSRYQKESGQVLLGLLVDRTSSCSIDSCMTISSSLSIKMESSAQVSRHLI